MTEREDKDTETGSVNGAETAESGSRKQVGKTLPGRREVEVGGFSSFPGNSRSSPLEGALENQAWL